MNKYLLLILLWVCPMIGQTKVGSTAAPFLSVGIGPRAVAMGGAFVATANDATSLYWNPSGASRIPGNEILFSHSRWFVDINYNWVGAVVRAGSWGTIGLSITSLDYGDMEVTTMREQEGTGEHFSASDIALGLTYARNLTDRFSLGANVKYINQRIWNSSASALAVDVGTLFISDLYGLRIGAAISNFGTDMRLDGKDLFILHDIDGEQYGNNDQILSKLNTDSYPLPLLFRVGVAKDYVIGDMHRVTLAADALHPSDNSEGVNAGLEYAFRDHVFFRGGMKSMFMSNSEEGLTLGMGLRHEFSTRFIVTIDYAYQEYGQLDFTQHVSVGVRF